MSTFWSGYIALLTLGTIVALFWLIFATRKGESAGTTDQTMGHAFDGIEEYDNPLPRWWFLLFIGTLPLSPPLLVLPATPSLITRTIESTNGCGVPSALVARTTKSKLAGCASSTICISSPSARKVSVRN